MTSKEAIEELKEEVRHCCYDGKNLGYYKEHFEVIEEELVEKEKLFSKLYLATEENKALTKELKRLEKKYQMLVDRLVDYASRLGIPNDYKKIL